MGGAKKSGLFLTLAVGVIVFVLFAGRAVPNSKEYAEKQPPHATPSNKPVDPAESLWMAPNVEPDDVYIADTLPPTSPPPPPPPTKPVPQDTWAVCVSVDPSEERDAAATTLADVLTGASWVTTPTRVILSLRDNAEITSATPREDIISPTKSQRLGVAGAFSACTARASAFEGFVFCEARSCPGADMAAAIDTARQTDIAMNRRHTVFAAVSRVVATLGVFEENLFPAIDGLAVDYAIRWHLTMQHRLPKDLMRKVRRIAHRRKARTMHHLLAMSGHRSSDLSVVDATRRDRCNAGNVLATKYMSNGMNLVNGDGRLALIQVPLPIDTTFRSCVRSGDGVRRHLCGQRRHCVFDGSRSITGTEKKLHVGFGVRTNHTMWFGWSHVLAARIGFLLKLAQDQPWREDIVHGVVMTVTPKDIAAMKDTVLTYDAPIKMFTVLLNGRDDQLAGEMRGVAAMVAQDGVGSRFHFFYEPSGVRDIDGWNGQVKHIFRGDRTSRWAWITEPTAFVRPSYLACFAKGTTAVQDSHAFNRLHSRQRSVAIMRRFVDRIGDINDKTLTLPVIDAMDGSRCVACTWDACTVETDEGSRPECEAVDTPTVPNNGQGQVQCCRAKPRSDV